MEYAQCPHCQKSFRPHGLKIHISKIHGIHRPLPTKPSISTPSPPPSPEMALLEMQLKLELVKLKNQDKELEKAREDMQRRDKELELRAKELDLQDKKAREDRELQEKKCDKELEKAREDREHDALQREKDRQHQTLIQREALAAMNKMHMRESKCVQQYQQNLLDYQKCHNQRFGRLFYDAPGTSFTSYSNNEFLLYGTQGEPFIQTADLVQYIGSNIFKPGSTVFGLASKIVTAMAIKISTGDVRKITRPYRSFCPTFPDSESQTSFVRLHEWDDLSRHLENVVDVSPRIVEKKLEEMCAHYPFSRVYGYLPYPDPHKDTETQNVSTEEDVEKNDDADVDENTTVVSDISMLTTDDDSTDKDDETTTKKWTVDMPPPRMPLDDISTKYLEKGEDGMVHIKDDQWGEHRSLPPDRNFGDGVDGYKVVKGQRDKLIHTMKGAMSKNNTLKPTWIEKLAKNRARIHITQQRLKNSGICISDALDRYYQDQQKQYCYREIDFDKRDTHQDFRKKVWKVYFGEQTTGRCITCDTRITQKSFTIGHIVPSKQGIVGSNEHYNVRPLCWTCNQKNGSLDSIVWEKSEKGEMLSM